MFDVLIEVVLDVLMLMTVSLRRRIILKVPIVASGFPSAVAAFALCSSSVSDEWIPLFGYSSVSPPSHTTEQQTIL